MLEINYVRAIDGAITLPASSDLLLLSITAACALKRQSHISPVPQTPLHDSWITLFNDHCTISQTEHSLLIDPITNASADFMLNRHDIPYRDVVVFAALGAGKTVQAQAFTPRETARITAIAALVGCQLQIETGNGIIRLKIDTLPARLENKKGSTAIEDTHALIGLAMGGRRTLELTLDHPFVSPLRELMPSFGCPITVSSNTPPKPTDPIARRIAAMQAKRNPTGQQFKLEADFSSVNNSSGVAITLPGDEVLASLLFTAKSLVQKGSLTIENIPLESWAVQNLQLIRKMGCKIGIQETTTTSFGSCGSIQLQRFTRIGRKIDCLPRTQFEHQIPAMTILAAFAEGQSVFRNCAYLRDELPDGIYQITQLLRSLDVRFGEMPDGFVLDGAKQYDGFDSQDFFTAPLAGAAVIAALHCRGTSTINDQSLIERWPTLSAILSSICDFAE